MGHWKNDIRTDGKTFKEHTEICPDATRALFEKKWISHSQSHLNEAGQLK